MAYQKKTDNPKMGRPKLEINWKQVETLCQIQATQEEIAAVLEINLDMLCQCSKRDHGVTFQDLFKK